MSKITKVSRCTNNAGIPVIILSKRSYGRALMIITAAINKFKFDFHFSPIKRSGDYKNKYFSFSYWSSTFINSLDRYSKRGQNKSMAPNKFQNLYKDIQSMLQFMNSSKLHNNQQFCLTRRTLAQILLKIYKLDIN